MKHLLKYLLSLLILSGCSSYVQRVHDQIDRETGQGQYRPEDKFDFYRGGKKPKVARHDGSLSTAEQSSVDPMVKRLYVPEEQAKKRVTANDLNDNQSDGSLWASDNANAFLFTSDTSKKSGDIVLINVQERLKTDITAVLKRSFPPQMPEKKDAEKGKAEEGKDKSAAKEKEETASAPGEDGVHDRISSVVIEEINKEHILLRGRKGLLYKGSKRTVEVQALVARKDISTEDSINSDKILETSVNVVR